MNILLNIFPVCAGGGQQVASNFLKVIAQNDFGHAWFIYTGNGFELHKQAMQLFPEKRILAMPYSYKARIFNNRLLKEYISNNKIDIIYNYAPILSIKGIPQVVRTVYSNLYFPEINFWNDYPFFTRLKKKIIDRLRLRGTLKADGLIFENESMQARAVKLFNFPLHLTKYIAPSSGLFNEGDRNVEFDLIKKCKVFKILYLSTWHLNKNIHILPRVAEKLKILNIEIKFILSLDAENPALKKLLIERIAYFNVASYFKFIGKVDAKYVHQVVNACDAMILLSKLECFSSNVLEAYYFNKPLIISNQEWAVAACKDAAMYVNRDEADSIANGIKKLVRNEQIRADLVAKGKMRLQHFNTPEEKVRAQVEFLNYVYDQYKK